MKKEKQFITAFTGGKKEVEVLKAIAKVEDRTLSYMIRLAITDFVERYMELPGDFVKKFYGEDSLLSRYSEEDLETMIGEMLK